MADLRNGKCALGRGRYKRVEGNKIGFLVARFSNNVHLLLDPFFGPCVILPTMSGQGTRKWGEKKEKKKKKETLGYWNCNRDEPQHRVIEFCRHQACRQLNIVSRSAQCRPG